MLKFFAKYKFFGVVMLILSVIIMTTLYNLYQPEKRLPIYQPSMVTSQLVDTTVQYVRNHHKVGNFKLVDQKGDTITQNALEDKIYVADFFFTTCQSICIDMAKSMQTLQKEFKQDDEVMLVSHSVTPEIDDVAQLQSYAQQKNVNRDKWILLTGSKKHIYELARKHYLVAKSQGDGGKYDMVHTENFALVDKEKRIRGFYDGTDPDAIDELIDDIATLKKEYEKK